MKTLRESSLRTDERAAPSESATDSGPVRVHTEVTRLDRILNHSPAKFRRIWVWVVINSAKKFLRSLLQQRLRRRVIGALGVNCRAGVRNDGLPLRSIRSRLEVEWQARDIHPWDQGIAPEEAAQRFAQQCLEDVDAAISSLFESLPRRMKSSCGCSTDFRQSNRGRRGIELKRPRQPRGPSG